MNIQLKFDIGQTVYMISSRAAQMGIVESYTIKLNTIQNRPPIGEYTIVSGTVFCPTRTKYLNTNLDELYET